MLYMENVMQKLAIKRPIFHSEADFQQALAWQLQQDYPDAKIRLEYPSTCNARRIYLDIWLKEQTTYYAIELKYITRKLNLVVEWEEFNLNENGASDLARYDFIKDITRIEKVDCNYDKVVGYSILLTNDRSLWQTPKSNYTNDAAFRIHEGRILGGSLEWGPNTGNNTKKGREEPHLLIGTYKMNWADYSSFDSKNGQTFRYVTIKVDKV